MRLYVAMGVFLVALAGGAAAEEPADVVTSFYAAYEPMDSYGLPKAEDLRTLERYLTPRLRGLLNAARHEQEEFIRKNPDEKPPFVDGDLFSSLFEGFRRYRAGAVERLGPDRYRVKVDLEYWEDRNPKTITSWSDSAIVVRHEGRLLIDDFEFGGEWDFAQKGTLSGALAADCH